MTNKITKAVFPVGGLGTRFLPATKSIPKELLPIIDKPLIQYAVEEAIEAGIETLIFITSASKHAISDHFDPMPDLRDKFAKNKPHLLDKLETLPPQVRRVFVPQGEPLGLGHAVLQAEPLIEHDEMFAVILADDFIQSQTNPLQALIQTAQQTRKATISVEQVPPERISSYGVIAPKKWHQHHCQVQDIVEKPPVEQAPSAFGVIGRYVLPHSIFNDLAATKQDSGGEIQLTDALKENLKQHGLMAVELNGKRFDCGSREGFALANLHVAMQDAELQSAIEKYLQQHRE